MIDTVIRQAFSQGYTSFNTQKLQKDKQKIDQWICVENSTQMSL